MTQARFQIIYEGDSVRRGSMSVYDLSPALQAVGDLVREANDLLNSSLAITDVRVETEFKRGSFEVSLVLDQSIIEITQQVLASHGITDAPGLLKLLFGGTSAVAVVTGLIKVFKSLKGEKPKQLIYIDNSTTNIQYGNGNVLHNVDAKTAELYNKEDIRSYINGILRPLKKEGVDVFEVRKGGEIVERLTTADIPEASTDDPSSTVHASQQATSREIMVKVASISFEKRKWRFSDGGASFAAEINDKVFLEKLDSAQEGFFKGDHLKVKMTTVQSVNNGKLKVSHSIDKVVHHYHAATQLEL